MEEAQNKTQPINPTEQNKQGQGPLQHPGQNQMRGMPRPYPYQRPQFPQMGFGQSPYGMMPQFQGHMMGGLTPQQQQEQLAAMQLKFSLKTSLTETCNKHPNQPIIFENGDNKVCERCYFELEEKHKQEAASQDPKDIQNRKDQQKQVQDQAKQTKEEVPQETTASKQKKVEDLRQQLHNLMNNLSVKMQNKVNYLNMRYQQLSLYENTLSEKYKPVFYEMKQTIQERQLDYMTYLLKQLNQNRERVQLEKVTLEKLMNSFYKVGDDMTSNLENQLKNIEIQDKESQKIVKEASGEEVESENKENDDKNEAEKPKINAYQVEALSTVVDDYENIITKNYCVYTNYEDFSFAQSRSKQQLEQQFVEFVKTNFSGDYQLTDWFNQEVLPRIYLLQQNTKFIYTYKILHYNSECQLIQNTFTFPEKGRYIATPEGQLYFTGGYYHLMKHFSPNTFILDEHRSLLVALKKMSQGRADHAVMYFKGNIYVFGGMAHDENGGVHSIKSCECYNIGEDKWSELPAFTHARQSFSVCTFNDKYFFVFGGKALKSQSTWERQAFDYVTEVEVFDIDRSSWRTINYISDKNRLRLLNPGTFQITGKKVLIFGGITPLVDEEDENVATECGTKVAITNESWFFNVTNGEIKRAPDLVKASYYISGGNVFPQQGKIHAFGFGVSKDSIGYSQMSAESHGASVPEINPNINKKVLHSYKVADHEWIEVHEGIFTGQRKRSLDTLDEAF